MNTQVDRQSLDKRRLRDRIKRFYKLFNEQEWEKCFALVDPKLRDSGKIRFETYAGMLSSFFSDHGPLENVSLHGLNLHLDARSKLYGDLAHAQVTLQDREHERHTLQERWVKADDGRWYTRMMGLM